MPKSKHVLDNLKCPRNIEAASSIINIMYIAAELRRGLGWQMHAVLMQGPN
jgi:hypothetical protein